MSALRRPEWLLPTAALLVLSLPLAATSRRVATAMGLDRPYDVEYVPRGSALRLASPSVRLSVADYYWLQLVQYVGEPRGRARGFEKLFPLVDFITDLDPRHGYAYQSAGIMLSSVGRLDESDHILKKGMEPGRPGWWTFPFYLAFNDYFYRGDYVAAARWAKIAARTPGASPNISHLALALDVKSGSPEDAVHFLEEMRKTARDERTAAALDEQYQLAVLQLEFARLDRAVAEFRAKTGRAPPDLDALVRAGLLPAIPVDPFGGVFRLDDHGEVYSTGPRQRFRPASPGRRAAAPTDHPASP